MRWHAHVAFLITSLGTSALHAPPDTQVACAVEQPETKSSKEVFAKWFNWQRVVEPTSLALTKQDITNRFSQLTEIFKDKPPAKRAPEMPCIILLAGTPPIRRLTPA